MPEVISLHERQANRRAASRRAQRWGRRRLLRARFGWPLAIALGSTLAGPVFAQNLPQGGTVTGGSGTIQQINANLLQIQQNSQNLAIDWQSFNVGPSGIVRFLQPSSSSIALNRVIGNDPSMIFGQIQANGQVILLNPRGIYFGPNSMVDVNALVATTANIRNDDFMAGRLRFEEGSSDPNARVINEGLVSVAQGGFAILAAAGVQNTGRIVANGGTVVLAGTKTFTVDFHGDGLLSFAATGTVDQAPSGASALVDNSGIIEAAGGRVLMTARAARDVLSNVINTTGIVVAHTAQMVNGEIVIDGGDNGIVNVNGLVDASGRGAGETGGTVKVLGEQVRLAAGAAIDAAGDAGGGTVLVGGNYQGQGPERTARIAYMDAAAVIDASAVNTGDGGKVILWADDTASMAGTISARGGALSGNGGFVETSGKNRISIADTTRVYTTGATGNAGTWLIDPQDFTIASSGGDITGATIATNLLGGNVTILSTSGAIAGLGMIYVNDTISNSAGAARTLTLDAVGGIEVNSAISTGGYALNLNLWASGNIAIAANISTNGGNFTTNGTGGAGQSGGVFSNTNALDVGSGNITINQIGGLSMPGSVITSSGTVTFNSNGGVTNSVGGYITGPASLVISGTGNVTLNSASNQISNITFNRTGTAGNISIVSSISPTIQTSTFGTGNYSITGVGFVQSGGITQDGGGGTVTINGGTGSVTLSQTNAFTGPLTVIADSISVTAAQTLVSSVALQPSTPGTNIVFNGAGAGLQISAATLSNLTGASDLSIGASGSGTLSVANAYTGAGGQNLSLLSGGTMTVAYNVSSGGNLSLVSAKNVDISADLTTAGGDIYIAGNVTSWAPAYETNAPVFSNTAGNFVGVNLAGGVDINAAGGSIAIAGKGGDTGANQYGIVVASSASNPTTITTTGSGTITMVGQGGLSATYAGPQFGLGGSHAGIRLDGAASPDYVDISAQNGNIKLVGTGGGATASDNNDGIDMFNVRTRATGTGSINITGVAGLGASRGIVAILPDTQITTVSGDITMTGTGGGNYIIDSTFTGNAKGIELSGATIKSTGAGDILLNGIEGAAGPGLLINTAFGTTVLGAATMTGDLTIKTNSLTYSGTNTITHQNGTGIIAFEADTNSTSIGVNGGAGTLQVGSAVLGDITNFGTLEIGSGTQTGNITFAATTPGRALEIETTGNVVTNTLTMGTNALTISNGGTYTQLGGITGTGLVTFEGTGAVTATNGGNTFTDVAFNKTGAAAVSVTTTGALELAASTLGTGALTLTGAGITQSGALTAGGSIWLNAGANAITFDDIGNSITGNVRLSNTGANDVAFYNDIATNFGGGTTSVGGNLSVTTNGTLTQASALSVGGNATFDATGNTITLNNATNAVTGNVAFTNAADTVTWREAAAVSLAASSSAALSVQAGGAITQAGALAVTGAASFDAGTNAITLTNGSNAFSGAITLVNTGANDVQLTNAGAIDLNGSSVGGNLTLIKTGAGDITQSSPLTVGGTTTLTMNSGNLTLNQGANSFGGTVSITKTGTGTVTLQNGAPLDLGTSNIDGDLVLTANAGGITQSGVLSLLGDLTATAAGTIALSQNNSFAGGTDINLTATGTSGAITVSAPQTLSAGNFTAVADAGVLVTAAVTTGGGNITIWGNSPGGVANGSTTGTFYGVSIEGPGTPTALLDAGGGNIAIVGKGGSTDYQHGVTIRLGGGVVTTGAGSITITGQGGGSTGGTTAGVEFYDNGAYAQTQNGALTVTGVGGMVGGHGNPGVALATGEIRATGTGTVTVTGTGGAGGSVGINLNGGGPTVISAVNGNMVLLGTGGGGDDLSGTFGGLHSWGVNLGSNADVKTTGTGNLSVTANGGTDGISDYRIGMVMQQTALLRTIGTGAINVVANGGSGSGGNNHGFYIQDSGSAVSTTGGGNITLSGTAGAGGTTSGGIILSSSGTIVTTGGGNISLTGSAASTSDGIFEIGGGTINSSGTLLLSATWGIDLGSSNVIATGDLTVSNSFDNVTLTGIGNAFANGGSALILTAGGGGNATIHNSTATMLGATNVNGAFSLISDGALTQSGGAAFNIGTNADITVTSGNLTLTVAGNTVLGSIALTTAAGNASYVGDGNTLLGLSDVTGNLSVTANGSIGQVGAITVSGTSSFSAGANPINLNDTTNDFAGTVSLSNSGANDVTLTTAGNLIVGSINVGSGNLNLRAGGGGPGTITQSGLIVQQAGAAGVSLQSDGFITLLSSNVMTGPITVVSANAGDVAINNTVATVIGGASSVGVYSLTSGGAISQTGSVSTGDLILDAAGNITMTDAFNNAGDVSLNTSFGGNATYNEIGYTSLKSANVAGNLSVTADNGDLAQSGIGGYTIGGSTTLTTLTSGYITLNKANSFGSAVTLTAAGAVNILAAQTVASGGFTANAGGAISVNSGGGITTTNAPITLTSSSNIAFSTAFLTSNGGDIGLTAGPGGTTSAEFLFTNINAGGGDISITGQGATSGSGQHGIWIGSSSTVQTNGAGAITLTGTGGASSGSGNVGVFVYGGTVQTAAGDITVNATGGGTSGSSGSNHGLAVQSGGHIDSTSGDINITGTASTGGGSGNSNYGVTLEGGTTLVQTGGGGFVTISGTGGTATGGSNTGIQIATGATVAASAGNLTATGIGGGGNSTGVLFNGGGGAGGLLSFGSGAVVINGTGSGSDSGITAIGTNSILGGGSATGAVQFGADSLNLGSSVAIQTTNQVRFNTQTAGLTLGINNSGSAFNLTSATIANVSPTASLIVLGDVAATGTITVGTDAANTFTTGIALRNSGGANPINIVGALSTAGDLDVSAGGAVTQTGALTVGGTSYFNAGTNVTLANASNAMSGDIGFSAMGGNVTLTNSGPTSFSNSFTTGTLSVSVTGGTVSQTGALNVTGATTVTSDAAIAWNNASNAFGGPLNITTTSGANATVYNSLATTLNTVSVAGNLDVASASTLGQGASPLTVGGTSHFSSVGATTLADASNSFGGAVSLMTTSGGNATIAATGQLILGMSTIAGNFLASVGSPMSQTGALAVSGTAGFTASNGPLTLTNTSNTFGGAVTLTNTGSFSVGIAATGSLTLGNVAMAGGSTGGFTATATNGLSQAGGTTIQTGSGATVLAGGSGAVNLGAGGNAFGSTVTLSGTGGTLGGTVNGLSGSAVVPYVTATGGLFSVSGASVGTAPPPTTPTTQTTTQTLNEIARVAPVDNATRVETPQTNNAGLSGPAFESTNTASTGDLSGGQQSGGANNEEQGTTTVAGGPPPPAPTGGQGPTPPTGPGASGGPPPPTILVSGDAGTGGSTPNDVRSGPAPQPGPVALVPGVLTSVPGTPPASGPGTPGITQSFPQQGNSSLW